MKNTPFNYFILLLHLTILQQLTTTMDDVLRKIFALVGEEDKMKCKLVSKEYYALLENERYHLTTYISKEHIQIWIDTITPYINYDTFAKYWKIMDPMYKMYVACHKNEALEQFLFLHDQCVKVDGTWYTKKEDDNQANHEYLNWIRRLEPRELLKLWKRIEEDKQYQMWLEEEEEYFNQEDEYDEYDVVSLMKW